MNVLRTSFRTALITLVILNAIAGDTTRAAQPVDLQIDCGHRYISQADAARLFGTNNVSHVYAERQMLYANRARACAGRQGKVALTAAGHGSAAIARARRR